MKELKIMVDYECTPIWIKNSVNEIFINTPVENTALLAQTKNRIKEWDFSYQQTYNRDVPQDSGFSDDVHIEMFEKEGLSIWEAVIDELEANYIVSYFSYKKSILLYPTTQHI